MIQKTARQRKSQVHQFKEKSRMDAYRSDAKLTGRTSCALCRAVHYRGRWLAAAEAKRRSIAPRVDTQTHCPACRQLEEKNALGVIELRGMEWRPYEGQIQRLVRKTEKIARSRNDQERILWMQWGERPGDVPRIFVSLPELARRIGKELEKSFHGKAEYSHSTEEPFLRVRFWSDHRRSGETRRPQLQESRRKSLAKNPPARSKGFRKRGSIS